MPGSAAALKIEPPPPPMEMAPTVEDIKINPVTGDFQLADDFLSTSLSTLAHLDNRKLEVNPAVDLTLMPTPVAGYYPGGTLTFNTPLEAQVMALANPTLWQYIKQDFNQFRFHISPPTYTGTDVPIPFLHVPQSITYRVEAEVLDHRPLTQFVNSTVTASVGGQEVSGYLSSYQLEQNIYGQIKLRADLEVLDGLTTFAIKYPEAAMQANMWGIEHKAYMVKDLIRRQLQARNQRKRVGLDIQASSEEVKARETLRDMITEAEWRRYITNGFIMVKGQSGKYYQIFNRRDERVKVYEGGKHTQRLCIHSSEECPPTDHVINVKVLAEIDENALWGGSNKYEPTNTGLRNILESRLEASAPLKNNLVEIVRQTFKVA